MRVAAPDWPLSDVAIVAGSAVGLLLVSEGGAAAPPSAAVATVV